MRARTLGDNPPMSSHDDALAEPVNPQKGRTGFNRMWHATGFSLAGLRAGWGEDASGGAGFGGGVGIVSFLFCAGAGKFSRRRGCLRLAQPADSTWREAV